MGGAADLVLIVGTLGSFATPGVFDDLRRAYPRARFVTCARPLSQDEDEACALVAVAISFERCLADVAFVPLEDGDHGARAGRAVGQALAHEELRHVFVFGAGAALEERALAGGLARALAPGVSLVGGLLHGLVGLDATPDRSGVVAVGLRGARLDLSVRIEPGAAGGLKIGDSGLPRDGVGGGARFGMLLTTPGSSIEASEDGPERLLRQALGARSPVLHVPVRATVGRCEGMALPLSFADGLALVAVGEARGRLVS